MPISHTPLARKPFGRTGHESSRVIFGAAALGTVSQAEADRALDSLLEYGVNHLDTAASYGESELRLGPWLEHRRTDFFLASKTGERGYAKAKESLHRSLERLRTDHLDLIQLHCLIDDAQWEMAMGPGGALEALVEAREQGLVRYIGVTGHELRVAKMHQRSLARFDFDSILLPLNFVLAQNAEYFAEFSSVMATAVERNVAVQTIKCLARGPKQDPKQPWTTWYEPLVAQKAIDEAVHWVLGDERVFLNTPGDIKLLPLVLDAASRADERPSDEVMREHVSSEHVQSLFV